MLLHCPSHPYINRGEQDTKSNSNLWPLQRWFRTPFLPLFLCTDSHLSVCNWAPEFIWDKSRPKCPSFSCDVCTAACAQTVLALCWLPVHHLVPFPPKSCALPSQVLVTLSVVSQDYNSCKIYVLLSNARFTCQHRDHSNLSKKYLSPSWSKFVMKLLLLQTSCC